MPDLDVVPDELPGLTIPGTDISYTPGELLRLESKAELVRFFQDVRWDLFTTHTFTRPVGRMNQYALWQEYLDCIKAAHRDTIGLLWSVEEIRSYNAVHRLAPNYHCLWVSNKPIDEGLISGEWMRRAGTSGRPIDIQRCDGSPGVISYLLKLADHPDCHWEFSPSLQLFMRDPVDLSTSQGRRRNRRFLARAERRGAATTKVRDVELDRAA